MHFSLVHTAKGAHKDTLAPWRWLKCGCNTNTHSRIKTEWAVSNTKPSSGEKGKVGSRNRPEITKWLYVCVCMSSICLAALTYLSMCVFMSMCVYCMCVCFMHVRIWALLGKQQLFKMTVPCELCSLCGTLLIKKCWLFLGEDKPLIHYHCVWVCVCERKRKGVEYSAINVIPLCKKGPHFVGIIGASLILVIIISYFRYISWTFSPLMDSAVEREMGKIGTGPVCSEHCSLNTWGSSEWIWLQIGNRQNRYKLFLTACNLLLGTSSYSKVANLFPLLEKTLNHNIPRKKWS